MGTGLAARGQGKEQTHPWPLRAQSVAEEGSSPSDPIKSEWDGGGGI